MVSTNLKNVIEDHALQRVPDEERKSWRNLSWNTMGIVSTLVQLLVGGVVTFTAGIWVGIIAAIMVTIIGALLGWLVGHISFKEGLSSTVIARYHGLGTMGSLLASGIYGFMIIGMLALENALLYEGILFYLKLPNNVTNAVLIYGALSLVWIILATFGIKLVTRVSSVLTILFLIVLVYMVFISTSQTGLTWTQILTHGAIFPGGTTSSHFVIAVNMLIGSAGALALVDADYGRYAKSSRDVFIMALLGNIMMDIIMFLTGAILIFVGFETVQQYYINSGMSQADAANAALNNVGATFIILGGLAGTLLMLLAQAKAQVLNTYSSSLALSNLFDTLKWRPGRLFMVVISNIVGLLMIAGNILGLINSWLTVLGVMTTCLAVIMVADYFIVQKQTTNIDSLQGEAFNWAGVITLVVGSVLAMLLQGIIPIAFVTSTIISLIFYPILRIYVFKPQTGYTDSILRNKGM
ncbi:MAG: purine-cytosine permease-like transporter [Desulfosporosinus sp. BRH_c37]|nr:MAG: purine-cytosine permease-like transporter [Desulfosporosinus sp. BRH_c37]